MANITAKQKMFADEYIKCGNAEQAAGPGARRR
jgi:phage terminase small subunit